jgi:hypothetical protein
VRYVKFVETCSAFGRLTRLRLQPTHDLLGGMFGFSRDSKPDADQISIALAAMVQVRFRLLHLLAQARQEKRKRKLFGDRRKQRAAFTKADVIQMFEGLRLSAGK